MTKIKEKSCPLNRGYLALYGGGISRKTLETFMTLMGGSDRRGPVAVITHAAEDYRKEGRLLKSDFEKFGVDRVILLYPGDSPDLLREARGVYACGGSQTRLLSLLERDGSLPVLKELHKSGIPYGGNSAGAAGAPKIMVADGLNRGPIRKGALVLKNGIGLLEQIVIDTHANYNRVKRDIAILAENPSVSMVIGLEENAGILLRGCSAQAVGSGQVYLIRRGSEFSTDIDDKGTLDLFHVYGATVDFHASGDRFEIPEVA